MKKTFRYYAIVWTILLIAYNVIVFALQPVSGFTKYDGVFWLAWIFILAAFAGQLACAFIAFRAENREKLFLNIPLITESYTALILMTVVGSILMLIPNCPAWIAAIVCVMILAVSAVAVVSAKAAAEIVGSVDEKVKVRSSFIRTLTADAESLSVRARTPEIRAEVKKVYEAVRYSDPMSSEGLAEIERQVMEQFSALAEAVKADDSETVKATAKELLVLIGERNTQCKLRK